MSWIKREASQRELRRSQALNALTKSEADYQEVQRMRPVVQTTVRNHLQLQHDNHFAQKLDAMWGQR